MGYICFGLTKCLPSPPHAPHARPVEDHRDVRRPLARRDRAAASAPSTSTTQRLPCSGSWRSASSVASATPSDQITIRSIDLVDRHRVRHRPERVAARRRREPRGRGAPLDHRGDHPALEHPARQPPRGRVHALEERRLQLLEPGRLDVRVEGPAKNSRNLPTARRPRVDDHLRQDVAPAPLGAIAGSAAAGSRSLRSRSQAPWPARRRVVCGRGRAYA